MISVKKYFEVFKNNELDFFTGVPDSLLKNFLAYVADTSKDDNHIITANEGASIALASGYYLATQKTAVVYMQNSGLGNAINPLLSLATEHIYKIPLLLLIGWRGEPNIKDEPQHVMQGKVTIKMLEIMQIPYVVIDANETESIKKTTYIINETKRLGKPHAIVVKKNAFSNYTLKPLRDFNFEMSREAAMKIVVKTLNKKDIVVSTTGKLSRELFEYREEIKQNHHKDFLTVGSMGYASMIALGIAKEKTNRNIFCFDGDGSVLMHAGNLSNIGNSGLKNFKHIVFNNSAHESVGGQETLALKVDLPQIAKSNGYSKVNSVSTFQELKNVLPLFIAHKGISFLEIKINLHSRSNLGRPTIAPLENKKNFMINLMNNGK
jgi:phosphonopyruvate decarboxylase